MPEVSIQSPQPPVLMPPEKKSFINVDELMPQVSVEQAATFYRVPLPELHRVGRETRSRCFLHCGRTGETSERVLAIQAETAVKTTTRKRTAKAKETV